MDLLQQQNHGGAAKKYSTESTELIGKKLRTLRAVLFAKFAAIAIGTGIARAL